MNCNSNRRERLGLLDDLVKLIGCDYISDLTKQESLTELRKKLGIIEIERYSIEEWIDAVEYIAHTKKNFLKTIRAHRFLVDYCGNC